MKLSLRDLLGEHLNELYNAEKQTLRCLQRTLRQISINDLREAVHSHLEETQGQLERISTALEQLDLPTLRRVSEGMRSLVDEAQFQIDAIDRSALLDFVIVSGLQQIKHYEIASYATAITLAEAIDEPEVADSFREARIEEHDFDGKLGYLATEVIIPLVMESEEDDDDDTEADEQVSAHRG
jgi:ferritin-like metal-binding protein YciE